MKTCSKCGITKSTKEFNKNHQSGDGLRPNCRECQGVAQRTYYLRTRKPKGTKSGTAPLDLRGMRFGRLIATELVGKDKQGKLMWLCVCDCGNESIVRRAGLRNGGTTSCGCVQRESLLICISRQKKKLRKPDGEAAKRGILTSYKSMARKRKLTWNISDELATQLFSSSCHYCGVSPSGVAVVHENSGVFRYNGIDRVDNTGGYEVDNVLPACKHCNWAKKDRTYEEFIEWAARVASRKPFASQRSA